MADPKLVRAQLETMRRALGAAVLELLDRSDVVEIYTNGDGAVWADAIGRGRHRTGLVLARESVESFLLAAAHYSHLPLDAQHPSLKTDLPVEFAGRRRLTAAWPPIVDAPSFNLRRLDTAARWLESDYLAKGYLTQRQLADLRSSLERRENILVLGAARSGKTSLIGGLLNELSRLCPTHRVIVIEDTPELAIASPDHLALRRAPGVGPLELLNLTLEGKSPDRIVFGELRDRPVGAARVFVEACSTGHPGCLSSIHAESPMGALNRLVRIAATPEVPQNPELVGDAIDLLVHIAGDATGFKVHPLVRVNRYEPSSGFELETLEAL